MGLKTRFVAVVIVLALAGAGWRVSLARAGGSAGGFSYASLPDEAALYLNDMVSVRDTVMLPGGNVRVLLPPGTFVDTLILTENDARVKTYSVTPQTGDVYYSQAAFRSGNVGYSGGGTAYILVWDSPVADSETRQVKLDYLMSGAYWTPTYDMQILSDESVQLAFFAQVTSSALMLDETEVTLIAGRVDLSRQVEMEDQIMMNQAAVGYNEMGATSTLGIGSVDLQHIYPLGKVSVEPGDSMYVNLVDMTLAARRLLVWNASGAAEADVIYKVKNESEQPLTQGIVRAYQNGVFLGSDYIETTPIGSEGSVTVGTLPDVRVRRAQTQEYKNPQGNDYYQNSVTLEVENFSEKDLDLVILDRWEEYAYEFEFSQEPERQPDNLLRWEVQIKAGEKLTITYSYQTDA